MRAPGSPEDAERARWAVYAAITAALNTDHPKRFEVARALEALAISWIPPVPLEITCPK